LNIRKNGELETTGSLFDGRSSSKRAKAHLPGGGGTYEAGTSMGIPACPERIQFLFSGGMIRRWSILVRKSWRSWWV